jgi:hypothetical protein
MFTLYANFVETARIKCQFSAIQNKGAFFALRAKNRAIRSNCERHGRRLDKARPQRGLGGHFCRRQKYQAQNSARRPIFEPIPLLSLARFVVWKLFLQ